MKVWRVVVRNKVVYGDFRGCLVKVLKNLKLFEIFRFFWRRFWVTVSWRIIVNVLEVPVFSGG